MSRQGILLLLVVAFSGSVALADHWSTGIRWLGWSVLSGEELYQNIGHDWPKYALTHLFDDDPKTCWVYSVNRSVEYDPKPEPWLSIVPDWAVRIDAIGIINGYAKSEKLYHGNDRAARVHVTLNGGWIPPDTATQAEYDAKLDDSLDMQMIRFPRHKVLRLRIDITEIAPGEVHDLCISEVALFSDGRKIDMHMPGIVEYTPGDDCECGTECAMMLRSGKSLFGDRRGYFDDYAAWDSSHRLVADIAYTKDKEFTLVVVDGETGEEIHREHANGKVDEITWAGRKMKVTLVGKGKKPITYTAPPLAGAKATSPPEHPTFEDWQDHWRNCWWSVSEEKVRYTWPSKLPDDITQRWARQQKVLGLTPAQIEDKFGRPASTISNDAIKSRVYLYADFSVGFYRGKCNTWAPRAPYYEKWFAQQDKEPAR